MRPSGSWAGRWERSSASSSARSGGSARPLPRRPERTPAGVAGPRRRDRPRVARALGVGRPGSATATRQVGATTSDRADARADASRPRQAPSLSTAPSDDRSQHVRVPELVEGSLQRPRRQGHAAHPEERPRRRRMRVSKGSRCSANDRRRVWRPVAERSPPRPVGVGHRACPSETEPVRSHRASASFPEPVETVGGSTPRQGLPRGPEQADTGHIDPHPEPVRSYGSLSGRTRSLSGRRQSLSGRTRSLSGRTESLSGRMLEPVRSFPEPGPFPEPVEGSRRLAPRERAPAGSGPRDGLSSDPRRGGSGSPADCPALPVARAPTYRQPR